VGFTPNLTVSKESARNPHTAVHRSCAPLVETPPRVVGSSQPSKALTENQGLRSSLPRFFCDEFPPCSPVEAIDEAPCPSAAAFLDMKDGTANVVLWSQESFFYLLTIALLPRAAPNTPRTHAPPPPLEATFHWDWTQSRS